MKKNHNKLLQNIICSAVTIVMIFGILATVAYAEVVQSDPFQTVVLEVMSSSQDQRVKFVDDVLNKLTSSNYRSYVAEAKRILGVTVSDADMEIALGTYANYPDTHKNALKEILEIFELPADSYDTASFSDIQRRINFNVTGDSSNDKGFKLFVELFEKLKTFNASPVFYDGEFDTYKIDIKVEGNTTLKNKLNSLILSIEALNARGITNFDQFVNYIEAEINTNSYAQIYFLKVFLRSELGSSAYSGTLPKPTMIDPLQLVVLQVLDLPMEIRTEFVNDILVKLTSTNYSSYVISAKRILGVSVSDADVEVALKAYALYPSTHKNALSNILKSFELPVDSYYTARFSDIERRINYAVTGDSWDDRGFKLFVEMFEKFRTFNSSHIFTDGASDMYKIDIKIDGNTTLKNQINSLILSIESLNEKGITSFDGFVSYMENEINTNSYSQIYALKVFLKEELGSSAYAGTLPAPSTIDPLQRIVLEILNKPQAERIQFVNEVLIKLTSQNYASYVIEAKRILGISISDADMENALRVYASYSNTYQEQIEMMIKNFDLSQITVDTSKFPDLADKINYEITGNANDQTGVKFVIKVLDYISSFTSAMVYDDVDNTYKVDFKVPNNSTMKAHLDNLIKLIKSLEDRGVTDFESFLVVAEDTVNDSDNMQIYFFKKYLKDAYGNSVYTGTLPYPTVTPVTTPATTPVTTPATTPATSPSTSPTPTSTPSQPYNPPGNNPSPSPSPSPSASPVVVEPGVTEMPAAPFNDIAGHWAQENIVKLAEKKIINGYPDGSVKPDANITRAEIAVILVKAAGLEPAETITLTFKDAADIPDWSKGYVQAAVDAGIISGYEDNTYKPSRNLSREEMVVLMMKAFEFGSSENTELAFVDAEAIGGWAKAFVAKSVEMDFVKGYPDNTFKPKRSVTRAEAFTVLVKAMEAKEATAEAETEEEASAE